MKPFLIRWATTTFAVLIATAFVPGITAESPGALVVAGLLLGVLNAVLRPVLLLVALPLLVASLGIFILFINAFLLHLVGSGWIAGFHVDGFGAAFFGGIVVSVASWAAGTLFKGPQMRFEVRHFQNPGPNPDVTPGSFDAGAPFYPNAPRPGEMKPVEGRVIEPENTSHESHPRQLP